MKTTLFVCLCLLVSACFADIYMHNPRGSNNRLSETPNNRDNAQRLFNSQNNNRGGYNQGYIYYYAGSVLPFEWTAQHGCGPNNETNCNIIIQYMCEDTADLAIRDGQTTNTPPDPETIEDYTVGRHEPYKYYADCKARQRNRGLFTSDQNLQGNGAIFTRQNPNGQRHGYECPEERDYYPYWHPSPWKDIAVIVSNTSICPYYQAESQNVKDRWYCSDNRFNNFVACNASGGNWLRAANYSLAAPDCVLGQVSRQNQLGNVAGGYPQMYNWTIPSTDNFQKCVIRLRYNISTGDYIGYGPNAVNASFNGANGLTTRNGFKLRQNPQIDIGIGQNLQMAINTAQYGRTFQDRTHTFAIKPRPAGVPADQRILNLNVRGKRGNIVQVYPAVEYDFVPNRLVAKQGDMIHLQWTGSNTNDPNNDGQGLRGTDRSNFVQINDLLLNYPAKIANVTVFQNTTDWFQTVKSFATLNQNNGELDDAAPYYDGGLVPMYTLGTYYYMSTRNNNFSNRSQKGTIMVTTPDAPVVSLPIVIGSVVGATAAVGGGVAAAWAVKTGKLASLIGGLKGAAAAPIAV